MLIRHPSVALVTFALSALVSVACGGGGDDDSEAPQHAAGSTSVGGHGIGGSGLGGNGFSAGGAGSGGLGGNGLGGNGTGGKPPACETATDAPDPLRIIDDMEDGNAYLAAIAGRNGAWWTAGDATVSASMVPAPTDLTGELAAPEALSEPRCGSHEAMRVTGQGFLDWGAALGAALVFTERANGESGAAPYDASAYTGIEFYARIGDTSTNEVRIQVSDSNSEPDGGVCVNERAGHDQCYDSFGMALPELDTTWRHYRVPFAGLSQRDFGYVADGVVTSAIYQISFNFPPSSVFDFSVDDLAFY